MAYGFDQENVAHSLNLYEKLMNDNKFPPNRISYVDEASISVVPSQMRKF